MAYKAGFNALEIYRAGEWVSLDDPDNFVADTHPLSIDPIAEQVAQISLPDILPTKQD
jgi:arginine-tRNA-protein transferase